MSQVQLRQDCVLLLNKTDFLPVFYWLITPVDVIEDGYRQLRDRWGLLTCDQNPDLL